MERRRNTLQLAAGYLTPESGEAGTVPDQAGQALPAGRLTLTASEQDTQQRDIISFAASCFDAVFLYKNNCRRTAEK